jgi:hypothetical protein
MCRSIFTRRVSRRHPFCVIWPHRGIRATRAARGERSSYLGRPSAPTQARTA